MARLRAEQRTLNQQIQSLYDQANQLLVQPGQDERTGKLLEVGNWLSGEQSTGVRQLA